MKISLETAALGVAGSDQARPGGLELEQLGSQLCLQPGVLEGEKRGGACGLEDRTLADQPIVVDDGCEGTLGGPNHRQGAAASNVLRDVKRGACLVDEATVIRQPKGELQAGIAHRTGQSRSDLTGWCVSKLDHEIAERSAPTSDREYPDEDGHRDRNEIDPIGPDQRGGCLAPRRDDGRVSDDEVHGGEETCYSERNHRQPSAT